MRGDTINVGREETNLDGSIQKKQVEIKADDVLENGNVFDSNRPSGHSCVLSFKKTSDLSWWALLI